MEGGGVCCPSGLFFCAGYDTVFLVDFPDGLPTPGVDLWVLDTDALPDWEDLKWEWDPALPLEPVPDDPAELMRLTAGFLASGSRGMGIGETHRGMGVR